MPTGDNVYWKHKKTGGIYTLLYDQATWEADLNDVVVYRALSDGRIWVRPTEEFFDGRFEMVEVEDGFGKQNFGTKCYRNVTPVGLNNPFASGGTVPNKETDTTKSFHLRFMHAKTGEWHTMCKFETAEEADVAIRHCQSKMQPDLNQVVIFWDFFAAVKIEKRVTVTGRTGAFVGVE